MSKTEDLMEPVFDKWVVYGHESEDGPDGGADFEYLLSRPTAFSDRDCGCVKMRRRVHEVAIDQTITTHGRRWDVYPRFLEEQNEDELKAVLDRFCEAFMQNYRNHPLNWGRYS